jgi:hypothetical protein
MREGTVIICAQVEGNQPLSHQIAGTVIENCDECGQGVYIAPSGQLMAETAEPPVSYLCIACGWAMLKSDPDPTVLEVTQEQLDEMARHHEHNV